MSINPWKTRFMAGVLLLILLALWELAVRQWGLSALVLPAPSAVGLALMYGALLVVLVACTVFVVRPGGRAMAAG